MMNQLFSTDELLKTIRFKTKDRTRLVPTLERAALIIIDMQNHFCSETGRSFFPSSKVALENTLTLLNFWKGPKFFTQHSHADTSELGMIGKFYRDYIRSGEFDAELVPELIPFKSEPSSAIIRKFTYDAFYKTDLETMLRSKKIDQVIICGVLTHLCCDMAARSAFVRGFEVFIAADATASDENEFHIGALTNLADGVARVLSVKEIISLCQ